MSASRRLPSRCPRVLVVVRMLVFISSARAGDVRLEVKEGSDVVLPCSVSGDITGALFDWRRDGQTDVFLYDAGIHYNNGRPGQDQQVKGRVSHFEDQLKNGNASIKITDTKVTDSGTYTCDFPRLQPMRRSIVALVVELVLKDRPGVSGAASQLTIAALSETNSEILLQCKVLGASPKPRVEWQNISGNKLPAAEPQVTERGGRYDVILQTTVTKTDRYRCVATQEEIGHQVHAETFIFINEPPGPPIGWIVAVVLLALVIVSVVFLLAVLRWRVCIKFNFKQGSISRRHLRGANYYPELELCHMPSGCERTHFHC